MPKTTFDITALQTEAQKSAQRVFHAGVGVTDLAVEVVRDYAAEAQKRLVAVQKDLTTRVADVQKTVTTFDPKAARTQAAKDAKARRTAVEKRVAELRAEAATVPARVQKAFDANVSTASKTVGATYGDLVKRGESLVGRIRRQQSTKATVKSARTTVAKAKTTNTQAKKASTAATKTADNAVKAVSDAAQKVGD